MIGLTGVARAGKDTFYLILNKFLKEKGLKSERLALADDLKKEIHSFVKENFKIDIFKCSPEEKEMIRPLMVAYGKCKRIQSDGTYWTSLIQQKVNSLIKNDTVPIITDVRYIEYKEDEYAWLKKHNGLLVHISRKLENGEVLPPANIEEKSNDNKLKTVSDISISWDTCQDVNFLYELTQKQLKSIYEKYLDLRK